MVSSCSQPLTYITGKAPPHQTHLAPGCAVVHPGVDPGVQPAVQQLLRGVHLLQEPLGLNYLFSIPAQTCGGRREEEDEADETDQNASW